VASSTVLDSDLHAFNGQIQAFDIHSIVDFTADKKYYKGQMYAIKLMSTYNGSMGDIIKIKTNSDFFVSPTGTDTNFIVFQHNDHHRVAFPA